MLRRFLYMFALTLLSCGTALAGPDWISTRIQTLVPAKKDLKLSDTMNIAIVANIYDDTRPDSLVRINYPVDSLLAVKAAMALKNRLQDSPIFSEYDFPVYNYIRTDDKSLEEPLPISVAAQLANDVQANYLLTVDIVSTQLWYEATIPIESDNRYDYVSTIVNVNVPYRFIFRLYNVSGNTISNTQVVNDTLTIETSAPGIADIHTLIVKELPKSRDVVIMACEQAGKDYADLIVYHWNNEIRHYYNEGGKDMRQAQKHVENDEWSEAMDIWMKYVDASNSRFAAMACFNMALGCEVTGEFELAIEWYKMSKKLDQKIAIPDYEAILYRRLNDKAMLDRVIQ